MYQCNEDEVIVGANRMQNLRSGVQPQSDKDGKDDDLDPEYDVEHRA